MKTSPTSHSSPPSAISLQGASASCSSGLWLDVFDWHAPARKVSVILGPGGTGKSRLLKLLGGSPPENDAWLDGKWQRLGQDLRAVWRGDSQADDVILISQRKRDTPRHQPGVVRREILDALRSDVSLLLLDEPNSWFEPAEWTILLRALNKRPESMTVVMVSHVQSLARDAGDYCSLMVNKTIHGPYPVETFFRTPPSRLVANFVRHGTVWPRSSSDLDVPSHFHWLVPGELAGMGRPGLLRSAEEDIQAIASAGISRLVSLTERPWESPLMEKYGIHGTHFPIKDMGVPSINAAARQCRQLERWLETNQRTVLHCRAGLGRTGTMLAAYLIWDGLDAERAISAVRAINPGFIQSEAQLRFLESFANST